MPKDLFEYLQNKKRKGNPLTGVCLELGQMSREELAKEFGTDVFPLGSDQEFAEAIGAFMNGISLIPNNKEYFIGMCFFVAEYTRINGDCGGFITDDKIEDYKIPWRQHGKHKVLWEIVNSHKYVVCDISLFFFKKKNIFILFFFLFMKLKGKSTSFFFLKTAFFFTILIFLKKTMLNEKTGKRKREEKRKRVEHIAVQTSTPEFGKYPVIIPQTTKETPMDPRMQERVRNNFVNENNHVGGHGVPVPIPHQGVPLPPHYGRVPQDYYEWPMYNSDLTSAANAQYRHNKSKERHRKHFKGSVSDENSRDWDSSDDFAERRHHRRSHRKRRSDAEMPMNIHRPEYIGADNYGVDFRGPSRIEVQYPQAHMSASTTESPKHKMQNRKEKHWDSDSVETTRHSSRYKDRGQYRHHRMQQCGCCGAVSLTLATIVLLVSFAGVIWLTIENLTNTDTQGQNKISGPFYASSLFGNKLVLKTNAENMYDAMSSTKSNVVSTGSNPGIVGTSVNIVQQSARHNELSVGRKLLGTERSSNIDLFNSLDNTVHLDSSGKIVSDRLEVHGDINVGTVTGNSLFSVYADEVSVNHPLTMYKSADATAGLHVSGGTFQVGSVAAPVNTVFMGNVVIQGTLTATNADISNFLNGNTIIDTSGGGSTTTPTSTTSTVLGDINSPKSAMNVFSVTTQSLTVTGPISLNGESFVSNDMTFANGASLSFTAGSTMLLNDFSSSGTFSGNVVNAASCTIESLSISTTLRTNTITPLTAGINNLHIVNAGLKVDADANVQGMLYVKGDSSFTGQVQIQAGATADSVALELTSGRLDAQKAVFSQSVTMLDSLYLSKNVATDDDVVLTLQHGTADVKRLYTQSATVDGVLQVTGPTTMNAALQLNGGDISNAQNDRRIYVPVGAIATQFMTIDEDLQVNGNVLFSQNANIHGSVTIENTSATPSDVLLKVTQGTVSMNNLESNNIVVGTAFKGLGNMEIQGTLTMDSPSTRSDSTEVMTLKQGYAHLNALVVDKSIVGNSFAVGSSGTVISADGSMSVSQKLSVLGVVELQQQLKTIGGIDVNNGLASISSHGEANFRQLTISDVTGTTKLTLDTSGEITMQKMSVINNQLGTVLSVANSVGNVFTVDSEGRVVIKGLLELQNGLSLQGSLSSSGTVSFADLSSSGTLYASTFQVDGTSTFADTVEFQKSVLFKNTLTTQDVLTTPSIVATGGQSSQFNKITINDVFTSNADVSMQTGDVVIGAKTGLHSISLLEQVVVDSPAQFKQSVTLLGTTSVQGKVNLQADIELQAANTFTAYGTLSVQGTSELNDLNVAGILTSSGGLIVDTGSTLTIQAGSQIQATGDTTLHKLTTLGKVVFDGADTVEFNVPVVFGDQVNFLTNGIATKGNVQVTDSTGSVKAQLGTDGEVSALSFKIADGTTNLFHVEQDGTTHIQTSSGTTSTVLTVTAPAGEQALQVNGKTVIVGDVEVQGSLTSLNSLGIQVNNVNQQTDFNEIVTFKDQVFMYGTEMKIGSTTVLGSDGTATFGNTLKVSTTASISAAGQVSAISGTFTGALIADNIVTSSLSELNGGVQVGDVFRASSTGVITGKALILQDSTTPVSSTFASFGTSSIDFTAPLTTKSIIMGTDSTLNINNKVIAKETDGSIRAETLTLRMGSGAAYFTADSTGSLQLQKSLSVGQDVTVENQISAATGVFNELQTAQMQGFQMTGGLDMNTQDINNIKNIVSEMITSTGLSTLSSLHVVHDGYVMGKLVTPSIETIDIESVNGTGTFNDLVLLNSIVVQNAQKHTTTSVTVDGQWTARSLTILDATVDQNIIASIEAATGNLAAGKAYFGNDVTVGTNVKIQEATGIITAKGLTFLDTTASPTTTTMSINSAGDATFAGSVQANSLSITTDTSIEQILTANELSVTTVSTFTGLSTFNGGIQCDSDLQLGSNHQLVLDYDTILDASKSTNALFTSATFSGNLRVVDPGNNNPTIYVEGGGTIGGVSLGSSSVSAGHVTSTSTMYANYGLRVTGDVLTVQSGLSVTGGSFSSSQRFQATAGITVSGDLLNVQAGLITNSLTVTGATVLSGSMKGDNGFMTFGDSVIITDNTLSPTLSVKGTITGMSGASFTGQVSVGGLVSTGSVILQGATSTLSVPALSTFTGGFQSMTDSSVAGEFTTTTSITNGLATFKGGFTVTKGPIYMNIDPDNTLLSLVVNRVADFYNTVNFNGNVNFKTLNTIAFDGPVKFSAGCTIWAGTTLSVPGTIDVTGTAQFQKTQITGDTTITDSSFSLMGTTTLDVAPTVISTFEGNVILQKKVSLTDTASLESAAGILLTSGSFASRVAIQVQDSTAAVAASLKPSGEILAKSITLLDTTGTQTFVITNTGATQISTSSTSTEPALTVIGHNNAKSVVATGDVEISGNLIVTGDITYTSSIQNQKIQIDGATTFSSAVTFGDNVSFDGANLSFTIGSIVLDTNDGAQFVKLNVGNKIELSNSGTGTFDIVRAVSQIQVRNSDNTVNAIVLDNTGKITTQSLAVESSLVATGTATFDSVVANIGLSSLGSFTAKTADFSDVVTVKGGYLHMNDGTSNTLSLSKSGVIVAKSGSFSNGLSVVTSTFAMNDGTQNTLTISAAGDIAGAQNIGVDTLNAATANINGALTTNTITADSGTFSNGILVKGDNIRMQQGTVDTFYVTPPGVLFATEIQTPTATINTLTVSTMLKTSASVSLENGVVIKNGLFAMNDGTSDTLTMDTSGFLSAYGALFAGDVTVKDASLVLKQGTVTTHTFSFDGSMQSKSGTFNTLSVQTSANLGIITVSGNANFKSPVTLDATSLQIQDTTSTIVASISNTGGLTVSSATIGGVTNANGDVTVQDSSVFVKNGNNVVFSVDSSGNIAGALNFATASEFSNGLKISAGTFVVENNGSPSFTTSSTDITNNLKSTFTAGVDVKGSVLRLVDVNMNEMFKVDATGTLTVNSINMGGIFKISNANTPVVQLSNTAMGVDVSATFTAGVSTNTLSVVDSSNTLFSATNTAVTSNLLSTFNNGILVTGASFEMTNGQGGPTLAKLDSTALQVKLPTQFTDDVTVLGNNINFQIQDGANAVKYTLNSVQLTSNVPSSFTAGLTMQNSAFVVKNTAGDNLFQVKATGELISTMDMSAPTVTLSAGVSVGNVFSVSTTAITTTLPMTVTGQALKIQDGSFAIMDGTNVVFGVNSAGTVSGKPLTFGNLMTLQGGLNVGANIAGGAGMTVGSDGRVVIDTTAIAGSTDPVTTALILKASIGQNALYVSTGAAVFNNEINVRGSLIVGNGQLTISSGTGQLTIDPGPQATLTTGLVVNAPTGGSGQLAANFNGDVNISGGKLIVTETVQATIQTVVYTDTKMTVPSGTVAEFYDLVTFFDGATFSNIAVFDKVNARATFSADIILDSTTGHMLQVNRDAIFSQQFKTTGTALLNAGATITGTLTVTDGTTPVLVANPSTGVQATGTLIVADSTGTPVLTLDSLGTVTGAVKFSSAVTAVADFTIKGAGLNVKNAASTTTFSVDLNGATQTVSMQTGSLIVDSGSSGATAVFNGLARFNAGANIANSVLQVLDPTDASVFRVDPTAVSINIPTGIQADLTISESNLYFKDTAGTTTVTVLSSGNIQAQSANIVGTLTAGTLDVSSMSFTTLTATSATFGSSAQTTISSTGYVSTTTGYFADTSSNLFVVSDVKWGLETTSNRKPGKGGAAKFTGRVEMYSANMYIETTVANPAITIDSPDSAYTAISTSGLINGAGASFVDVTAASLTSTVTKTQSLGFSATKTHADLSVAPSPCQTCGVWSTCAADIKLYSVIIHSTTATGAFFNSGASAPTIQYFCNKHTASWTLELINGVCTSTTSAADVSFTIQTGQCKPLLWDGTEWLQIY